MFERNINKVLDEYQGLFNCQPGFEFEPTIRKNRHILKISGKEDFVLDSYENLKIIENFCKKLIKLHYFKKLIFFNLFTDIDDMETCDVWLFRLAKQLKKRKGLVRNNSDLVIFNFGTI